MNLEKKKQKSPAGEKAGKKWDQREREYLFGGTHTSRPLYRFIEE